VTPPGHEDPPQPIEPRPVPGATGYYAPSPAQYPGQYPGQYPAHPPAQYQYYVAVPQQQMPPQQIIIQQPPAQVVRVPQQAPAEPRYTGHSGGYGAGYQTAPVGYEEPMAPEEFARERSPQQSIYGRPARDAGRGVRRQPAAGPQYSPESGSRTPSTGAGRLFARPQLYATDAPGF
jgi:hypothetical protein